MDINQGLKSGSTLRHGAYRIEKILGQGGFGITYLAMDLNLDRQVAIKEFFPKDYCDRDESTSHVTLGTQSVSEFVNKLKAKFLKEARNIAKLDHPGIIKIHAAFEENNTAYYVMDYVESRNLARVVREDGPLQLEKAIKYIKSVGSALEYVHAQKINHFDVKPANILIRESDDNPILIDFGLSKQYDSNGNQTSTTPIGMSHGFAPMEQYTSVGIKEFSPQTDIYSLAATLYYLLSGVVPPQATLLIDEELTFPPNFPLAMIRPISKAMSSGRKRRHESVNAFLIDLENALTEDKPEERVIQIQTKESPDYTIDENTVSFESQTDEVKKKRNLKSFVITIIGIIILIAVGMLIFKPSDNKVEENLAEESSAIVYDLYWESPLGEAQYSGEFTIDSVSGKQIPHGKGIARIIKGPFEGNVYDGEFVNGIMEGETTYKLKNGDVFEGKFKDNQFESGKYTIDQDGSYFEGTFKNMETDKGEWKDRKGRIIE